MNIRPLGARVLVRPLPADDVSAGGIIIPDTAKDKSLRRGVVVGVGPGYPRGDVRPADFLPHYHALDVKKDDRVLFGDHVGEEVEIDGVKHHLLHEEHILGVIEE